MNLRWLRLPTNIALLIMGLGTALLLRLVQMTFADLWPAEAVERMVRRVDFHNAVLNGVLAFLLFAAAITVDWHRLRLRARAVALLATIGVVVSAVLVAVATQLVATFAGLEVSFAWCFVFGALIAPTDPVAIAATLRTMSIPERLKTDVMGESLLNDGVGVVLFALALSLATGDGEKIALTSAAWHVATSVFGGLALGAVTGLGAVRAIRMIDDHSTEVMISLALATGTYALAETFAVSGPIAVVVAGVVVGNHGAPRAMSERTRRYFFSFWHLVDDLLNAFLFTLLGFEVLVLHLDGATILGGFIAVPIVLLARFGTVAGAVSLLDPWMGFDRGASVILTWAAVRGAISAALALSLPYGDERNLILAATYAVILFSAIIQGLTLPAVIRRIDRRDA